MVALAKSVTLAPEGAPWLVLVHALSGDHRVFDRQVEAFRERYRILLVDLPGHGLSAEVPGPYGHRELAGHVGAALNAAGLTPVHYWGTHTGAAVGLLLALDRPERFASLVLEGPVLPGRIPPSAARELAATFAVLEADGLEAAKRRWFEDSAFFEVMRRRPADCRAEQHRGIIAEFGGRPWSDPGEPLPVAPVEEDLKGLEVPVLAYNGERDLTDFLQVAEELARLMPHVQRHVIAEAGSFPAWEFPVRVNLMVSKFLSEIETSR